MANVKITELTALTDPASSDVLPIVDVGADTTKKVTIADLLENAGDGAAATPAFSFDNDKSVGMWRPGSEQLAFSTSGTTRLFINSSGQAVIGGTSPLDSDKQLTLTSTTTSGGLGILSPNNGRGDIFFGDAADDNVGQIKYNHVNDSLTIRTNASDRFTIDSSGRLLVGATSGSYDFEVKKSGHIHGLIGSTNAAGATLLLDGDSNGDGAGSDYASVSHNSDGNLVLENRKSASIIFRNTSSSTERLRITSAGLVGINETSPAGSLHVDAASGVDGPVFDSGGSGNANHALLVRDSANSQLLRVNNNGNCGIGVSSPSTKLQLPNQSTIRFGDSGTAPKADISYSSTGFEFLDIKCQGTTNGYGNIRFFTGSTPSEAATIDSSGRLLVGTSSSLNTAYKLQIAGETDAAANVACFRGNATGQALLALTKSRTGTIGNHTIVQDDDNIGGIQFRASDGTNYITGASIETEVDGTPGTNDMPSRLVFSTTADGASSPTERMRITSGGLASFFGATGVIYAKSATSAGTAERTFIGYHSATSNSSGGTISFNVFTNGNVTNTNNSYGAISDAKLKENIVDASSQWDDIKDLRVRNYNFIEGQTHTQIGVVAQEVETVSPGLVTESPDTDEEGNDLGTTTKSVNYSVLYMKAVKALQEAMDRIETLETSNADLLARVSALEAN